MSGKKNRKKRKKSPPAKAASTGRVRATPPAPAPRDLHAPLPVAALRHPTDPAVIGFTTTAEAEPLAGVAGQERAMQALELGVGMRHPGYNVFALGSEGSGRRHAVEHFLRRSAAGRPRPRDWAYVHNFRDAHEPCLLSLGPGEGRRLARAMEELVAELRSALTAAFESDEYQSRRATMEEELREHRSAAMDEVREKAAERGLATLRTPGGYAFAPKREGEVLEREAFLKLPDEERREAEEHIEEMRQETERVMRGMPALVRAHRKKLRELREETSRFAVEPLFADLAAEFAGEDDVVSYLEAAREDAVEHVRAFLPGDDDGDEKAKGRLGAAGNVLDPERRYSVNVVVDHGEEEDGGAADGEGGEAGAPVVYEDHPTYPNLMGRVEYLPRMGGLVTDFSLIKVGALQRANGGYLVLEAGKLLRQPFAWDGLKRALAAGRARIESPAQSNGLISTVTLEPEPMPLDVKVVVVGSRKLYYLLAAKDPEFGELFKIAADFDERIERDDEAERRYARHLAGLVEKNALLPFTADAVARLIEHSARLAGDAERLDTRLTPLEDLMREADHYARADGAGDDGAGKVAGDGEDGGDGDGAASVDRRQVQRAVEAGEKRVGRAEERLREAVLRDTLRVETDGLRVGQVNGLAVLALGGNRFGRATRITARVRMGKGEVVDIERQAKLSGPIHSKGVLILSSLLAARYAEESALSLEASLVFEQSYSGIDGDSASVAELVCLLSAIAEVPIRQAVAVTGSVDQHGRVQAIGGVNEKVQGFFRLCAERGLTGEQGVLIPTTNAKNLMLPEEVTAAAEAGDFHVWTAETVDEAVEVLTGVPAGEKQPPEDGEGEGEGDGDGQYPEGTVNRRVADRLAELAEKRRKLNARPKAAAKKNDKEAPKAPDKPPTPPPPVPPPEDETDDDDGPPPPEPPEEEEREDEDPDPVPSSEDDREGD